MLAAAGADTAPGLHVAFECCDVVEIADAGCFGFGVSIPMAKALSDVVLLAYAVNGERLAPEHGFPLRAVVPGFAGVRSPKWLRTIVVQDTESDNRMQQRDYKLMPPHTTQDTADWDAGITINEMPLNAAICEPAPGAMLTAGPVEVRGYAVANARSVARVDVSSDGGRNWRQAVLEHDVSAPWSWTFWTARLELAAGEQELVVRAWDSAGQTQPAQPGDTWNFKGYLSAAWHRVHVSVQ